MTDDTDLLWAEHGKPSRLLQAPFSLIQVGFNEVQMVWWGVVKTCPGRYIFESKK